MIIVYSIFIPVLLLISGFAKAVMDLSEEVVDGDTIHISADLGFDIWKKMKVRLARINCPEKNTDEGKKVKEYMSKYIGKEGIIESLKYDKYGRGLCEVYIEDKNISDELLSLGYAKQRDGKGVKPI